MPTPRTEGSHERDSGIKKAEISEWARDDQGSAQLVLQRQRGPRRLLGLELVLHHGSADGPPPSVGVAGMVPPITQSSGVSEHPGAGQGLYQSCKAYPSQLPEWRWIRTHSAKYSPK